jgi:hypothetical protein
MNSKLPLATVSVRVNLPRYYLPVMRVQSKGLPGCVRPSIGSESHFARTAIDEMLKRRNVPMNKILEFEIKQLELGISQNK